MGQFSCFVCCFTIVICGVHVQISKMGPDDTEEDHGQGDPLPLQSHPITIACCNQHLHQLLTSRLRKKMWACITRSILNQYDFHLQHTTHGSQIERYDLIVLHSWTFLAVTLADAKVVKHVESVMLKE